MPPLRLTKSIIEKAREMREYGGSDGACARHAGVTPPTFFRWLHFGELLQDYIQNGQEFYQPEIYRTWRSSAKPMIEQLKRELDQTGGVLSKEHRAYLKLWNEMQDATDMVVSDALQTIDKAKDIDPAWAYKILRWFHPGEYRDPGEAVPVDESEAGKQGETRRITLSADILSPAFFDAYRDIANGRHTEYLFYGGRGSTKSSFVSLAIIYLLVNNPQIHVLAIRQVGNTLRDSVYSQLTWAINENGLTDQFHFTTNPLEITYTPTGQKIYFRGADDPLKIKSIKPAFGYIGIAWFEELDQFKGPEAVRNIEQSAIRGGDLAYIFKSFNPPRTANNWANKYARIPKETQFQHKSDYRTVPLEWLGKVFIEEAEHLKSINPGAYEHEYLGEVNGTGGMVFENVELRKITDEEISQFDRVLHGLDWGYYPDPAHYARCHYDAARMTLYIFGEVRAWKLGNRALYDALVAYGLKPEDLLIADSAEPKSVADFKAYGASARGAEKGPESVKYSIKWLQALKAIVIDNERCPYTAEEFLEYEYEQDPDGNYISEYPDRNNHAIDSVRYATNLIWRRRGS